LDGYETGVEVDPVLSEALESSFQGPNLEGGGIVCGNFAEFPQVTPGTDVELECTGFDWISSWAPASKRAWWKGFLGLSEGASRGRLFDPCRAGLAASLEYERVVCVPV
jgi:hypothetical protein